MADPFFAKHCIYTIFRSLISLERFSGWLIMNFQNENFHFNDGGSNMGDTFFDQSYFYTTLQVNNDFRGVLKVTDYDVSEGTLKFSNQIQPKTADLIWRSHFPANILFYTILTSIIIFDGFLYNKCGVKIGKYTYPSQQIQCVVLICGQIFTFTHHYDNLLYFLCEIAAWTFLKSLVIKTIHHIEAAILNLYF